MRFRPRRPIRFLKEQPPHALTYRAPEEDWQEQAEEKSHRVAVWQIYLALTPFLGILLGALSWWLLSHRR
jgi:hypothetical protein